MLFHPPQSIPEVLRLYSKAGEDVRHASYHRIVVSTCSSAGLFHNIGVQYGLGLAVNVVLSSLLFYLLFSSW